MTYEFDEMARTEATKYPIRPDRVDEVVALCAKLGPDAVLKHRSTYTAAAWTGVREQLPTSAQAGQITRGDVFAVARAVVDGDRSPHALLAAVYIWGQGRNGYGRARYDAIVGDAGADLDDRLGKALSAARDDVIDGYAHLFGGYVHDGGEPRAAVGDGHWARIAHFGPAFFTKLLYFAADDALILDNVLAHRVHHLSGLPKLINDKGRARAWSPYRYAVYLHWMRRTAEHISSVGASTVPPDLLELALFTRPESSDEDEAGE